MWPFKKKEPTVKVPPPPSPCGEDEEHAYWREQGWACPICHRKDERARKDQERTQLAELIASKVVEKLRSEP